MGCCWSKEEKPKTPPSKEEPTPSRKEEPTPSKEELKPSTLKEPTLSKEEPNAPTLKGPAPSKGETKPSTLEEPTPSKGEPKARSSKEPTPSKEEPKTPTSTETTTSIDEPKSPTLGATKASRTEAKSTTIIPSRREPEPTISDEPTPSRTELESPTRGDPTPSRTESKSPTQDEPTPLRTEPKPPTRDEPTLKSPTSEECDSVFRKAIIIHVDDLIVATEKQLENIENMMQSREGKSEKPANPGLSLEGTSTSLWKSAVKSGDEIVDLVIKYIPNLDKRDFIGHLRRARSTVATILEHVGKVHWVVGGLCLVAFLMDQIGQTSDNKIEAIRLLREMIRLARHVTKLNSDIPEEGEKFTNAILMIFEGSILCASQLTSKSRLRMFGASVDTKRLNELESNISHLYQDLTLTVAREIQHQQPVTPPPLKPSYPDHADKEPKTPPSKERLTLSKEEPKAPPSKEPTPSKREKKSSTLEEPTPSKGEPKASSLRELTPSKQEPKAPTSNEMTPSKEEPKSPTLGASKPSRTEAKWPSQREKPAPKSMTPLPQIPTPTLEELFKKLNIVFTDNFLVAMENFLESVETNVDSVETKSEEGNSVIDFVTTSGSEKDRTKSIARWASFVKGGAEILEFLNKQIQPKGGDASLLFDARQALEVILQNVGILYRIKGTLCIIAYLLDHKGDVSDNQIEYIKLLKQMVKLTGHIRALNDDMPEEGKRFSDAILVIFEGSMMCTTLLNSKKFFSSLRDAVDATRLTRLRTEINKLYGEFNLIVLEKLYDELAISQSPLLPIYPDYAVGIQEPQNQVIKRLDMTTEMNLSLAVVIYGVDGIGKTTLANAVISLLDLKDYNYTGVEIHKDFHENDLKCLQQQILMDAFPKYENGRNLTLRDCEEGRIHLRRAFQCHANKPVFIFIDNVHLPEDIQEILPSDLRGLPSRSRILATTPNLGVTDILESAGLECRKYEMNGLPNEQAKIILSKHVGDQVEVNNEEMDGILKICGGIPLLLEIVGARLQRANTCTQIVEALRKGADIRAENVTNRVFDFVYNKLEESTQQAFLDICCFFTNWSRRHVEYIVGHDEVTLLEDAALLKASRKNELIVHGVIRAIGIEKSVSSRIRDLQALDEAVKDEKVKLKVKGLWLTDNEAMRKSPLEGALVNSMKNSLRVVALGSGVTVSEGIQKTSKFKELRFLKVSGDILYLPVDLESFERLAVYHGPVCIGGVNICQLPKNLRALKAVSHSDCTDLSAQWGASQSMEIRQNSSLEELDLQELKSLERLPDSLDHLTALKILLLEDCRFQVLPEQICRLSSLIELKLTGCKKLTELPSVGELVCLKKLNLAQCIEMKKLPESFTDLSSLEDLNLECCWKLKTLPSSFGKLINLKKLSLQSCVLKELPFSFGELRSLTEFKCNCIILQELPDSFERFRLLTNLDLSLCTQLKSLPRSIEKLTSLEEFNLVACYMLKELPSKVVDIPRLKMLNLGKCDNLKDLPASAYGRSDKDLTIILPDHLKNKIQHIHIM